MPNKFEGLVKRVYKKWKRGLPKPRAGHPDEQTLACFLEGRLTNAENTRVKAHLVSCDYCMEALTLNFRMKPARMIEVPVWLLERVKNLMALQEESCVLEIVVRLKEKILEILNTTGNVLVGQELIPQPVLRSRSIKDFKDEVTVLKDFKDIRVEIKIENKGGKAFDLLVVVKQKRTQKIIKDLRVTLLKDDLELESYLNDSGSVTFEHVLLGKYLVEISTVTNKLASILLDIKT